MIDLVRDVSIKLFLKYLDLLLKFNNKQGVD
jgi:hypothetical protein